MNANNFGPPFRPPCGGWPEKQIAGPVMHYRSTDKVDYWKNKTLVASGSDGLGTQKPYARDDNGATDPGCGGDDPETCNCPDPPEPVPENPSSPAAPLYGPWFMAEFPSCGVGMTGIDLNCYEKQSGQADYGVWRKVGFKNLQCWRWWHGMFGLLSHDPNGAWDRRPWSYHSTPYESPGCQQDVSGYGPCSYSTEDEQPTPDGTKYLHLEITAIGAHSDSEHPENDWTETAEKVVQVDRTSGVRYLTVSGTGVDADHHDTPHWMMQYVKLFTPDTGRATYGTIVMPGSPRACNFLDWSTDPPTPRDVIISETSTDGINWVFSEQDWFYIYDGGTDTWGWQIRTVIWQSLNNQTGEYHQRNYAWSDAAGDVIQVGQADITMTNTGFHYTQAGRVLGLNYMWEDSMEVTGTLSDANHASDVWEDMKNLMALWPLNDDKLYPWRIDSYVTAAPVVGRDEVQAPITPDSALSHPYGWLDPADGANPDAAPDDVRTGAITGAPLSYYALAGASVGGYGPHFDHIHKTYFGCKTESRNPVAYVKRYGAWSGNQPGHEADTSNVRAGDPTDDVMPPGATRWTENFPWPGRLPVGSWVMSSMPYQQWDTDSGEYVMVRPTGMFLAQKWAEIKVVRPSYNFFRPCGADRFMPDATASYRVVAASGEQPVVTLDEAAALTAGQKVVYCDASGIAKVYSIQGGSGKTWALGSALKTVTGLWQYPVGSIGGVLFPNCWPICGRVSIDSVADDGKGTLTIALAEAPPALLTGDRVDLLENVLAATVSDLQVTMLDDRTLTVPGYMVLPYDGDGFVASHGAPDAYWYDDNPKGDYVFIRWQMNQRDWAERQRVRAQWTSYPDCHWGQWMPGQPIRSNQAMHGMPQAVTGFVVEQHCLPFSACCPVVMCISPNGESWLNGTTHWPDEGLISAGIGDDRYGFLWQSVIQQDMPDPLWVPPLPPFVTEDAIPCGMEEDILGTCWNDNCDRDSGGTIYYAHRPMDEARSELPTIGGVVAPALPAEHFIGYLTLAQLDAGFIPPGVVLPPPLTGTIVDGGGLVLTGYGYDASNPGILLPGTPIMPWQLWLYETDCVCHGTRSDFVPIYRADAIPVCM